MDALAYSKQYPRLASGVATEECARGASRERERAGIHQRGQIRAEKRYGEVE